MEDRTKIIVISTVVVLIMLIILIGIIAHSSKASNKIYKYICADGYRLNNEKCYKELDSMDATITYSCDKGYELNLNKCYKYEKATPKTGLVCPAGYQKQGDNSCYREQVEAIAKSYYLCPYGYTLKGYNCVRQVITHVKVEYICPSGYDFSQYNTICIAKSVSGTCPEGTWVHKDLDTFKICAAIPQIKESCPYNAVREGNNCIETYGSLSATLVKICNYGYVLSNNDTICIKKERVAPTNQSYCDTGYNLVGNTCIKTITKNAYKKVTCNTGYTRVDEKCIKYDIKEPTKKEIKQ